MKADEHSSLKKRKKILYFEELFCIHYPRLQKFAFYILGDEAEANDMVQDVFVHTWNHFEQLENLENLSPYLFTLLKNKCLNVLKHQAVKLKYHYHQAFFESEELYHISFGETSDFISMEEELHQAVEALITKMPPKCGQVFRLKWIEGMKHREIADQLSISMTMVDKHLVKGMDIAKKYLQPNLLFLLIYYKL